MKPILVMLALAALLTAGCATRQQSDRDALLDCRSRADELVKARYTPAWDEAVRQCMDGQANP